LSQQQGQWLVRLIVTAADGKQLVRLILTAAEG